MLCPSGTYLSSDQICKGKYLSHIHYQILLEFSQTLQGAMEKSQLLSSAATQASNVVSKGRGISLSAAISGKIFSQIKYMNISYSGELEVALLTWMTSFVSLGLTPDLPESIVEKIPDRPVPYVFEKYEVPSSFLINFWEDLGVVVFVIVVWLLLKGAECLMSPKQGSKIGSLVRKFRVIVQNFLITAFYGVYGDLVMFSIIEYRTLVFGWNLSLLSFIISVVFLMIMFISFWYQMKLLVTYQKLKKQDQSLLEEFIKKHEGNQVLFKDFKDYSLAPQLFIFFLSARDLLFSLVLATMFEHPLPQTLIIIILDCLMIIYLFIKRPFESSVDFSQQIFFEIISLVVTVAVSINAILDVGEYEAMGTRVNIGKLLIIANMIFNFVTACFMFISIFQILKEFYNGVRERRAKKAKTVSRIKNRPPLHETQNFSQINLNKNLDSSQIFLQGNTFETTPHENSDLQLLPHQTKPPNSFLKPAKLRPSIKRGIISEYHPRHLDLNSDAVEIGDSRSRSPIKRRFYQSQESQERNLPQVNSFQNSRLRYLPDRPSLKRKDRFQIDPH